MTFWQKLGERLNSTKFLMALASMATSSVAYFKGEITADIWVGSITAVTSLWMVAQGRVDAAAKKNGNNP
jgi:hypothetical protein